MRDIPWPDLSTLPTERPGEQKPGAQAPVSVDWKNLQARWHPDRFLQKFGSRLDPGEREAIMAKVTAVAAEINSLRERVDRP